MLMAALIRPEPKDGDRFCNAVYANLYVYRLESDTFARHLKNWFPIGIYQTQFPEILIQVSGFDLSTSAFVPGLKIINKFDEAVRICHGYTKFKPELIAAPYLTVTSLTVP